MRRTRRDGRRRPRIKSVCDNHEPVSAPEMGGLSVEKSILDFGEAGSLTVAD